MVYVVVLVWLILGLSVFFVAMRRGPGRAAEEDGRGESKAGRRLTLLGVVVLIAFGLVVPTLVLAHNGNHKASEAPGGVQLHRGPDQGPGTVRPLLRLLPLAGSRALLRPHGPEPRRPRRR